MNIPEDLIIRFLSNEASPEEQLLLHKWVSESSINKEVFDEYCDIWRVPVRSDAFDSRKAVDQVLGKVQDKKVHLKPRLWVKLVAAASLLIALTIGVLLLLNPIPDAQITWETRSTQPGKKLALTLEDGTKVLLNSGSTISWPIHFKDTIREVKLDGEAFFEVQKNPEQPFIVKTGSITTKVLGTSFNVNSAGDRIEVSVQSGRVGVYSNTTSTLLTPLEKIEIDVNSQTWLKSDADTDADFGWREGTLVFKDRTLKDAFKILERWYNVKITYTDSAVQNCRITGKYKKETINTVLYAIAEATGIQYTINNREVEITGKGCQ